MSEAHPTAERLTAVAGGLRRAKGALAARPAAEIAETLGRVGARFLDAADPLRVDALQRLPSATGLSAQMAAAVLDGMAADWTSDRLRRLLDVELGGADALDRFVEREGRRTMAVGPSLCVQVVAGSVPGVGVSALIRSLLVKGPTLLKPGRGDAVLPALFAHALREEDAELADALAVVYWPGGSTALEAAALASADVVTVYGSDESVRVLRALAPITARFVAYHHRMSVGIVGRAVLTSASVGAAAADVAHAVALFDQRGCVSPQIVFVEEDGEVSPEGFAEALGRALADVEARLPTGPRDVGEASRLLQARGTAELLEGAGSAKVVHGGADPWTVVLDNAHDAGADLGGTSGGRFVRLRAIADAVDVPARLSPLALHLQTVGVAGLGERVEGLARALGAVGASRVTPFSAVPFPPPWWHHDGGGPLRDLVRWIDVEE